MLSPWSRLLLCVAVAIPALFLVGRELTASPAAPLTSSTARPNPIDSFTKSGAHVDAQGLRGAETSATGGSLARDGGASSSSSSSSPTTPPATLPAARPLPTPASVPAAVVPAHSTAVLPTPPPLPPPPPPPSSSPLPPSSSSSSSSFVTTEADLAVRGAQWRDSPIGLFSFSQTTVRLPVEKRAQYEGYLQLLHRLETHQEPDIANYAAIPKGDKRWRSRENFFRPSVPAPSTTITRIGGSGDGGKLVMNVGAYDQRTAASDKPCIVYSLGSNNDFSFEAAVVARTGCSVFTFDCTITLKAKLPPRTTFYKWCLGQQDGVFSGLTFKTLGSVTSALNHDHIDLLKIDIEGYEFQVMRDLVQWPIIPSQILMEVHGASRDMTIQPYICLMDHWTEFFQDLDHRGYRIVAYEPNVDCWHCSEYTLVHLPKEDKGVLKKTPI